MAKNVKKRKKEDDLKKNHQKTTDKKKKKISLSDKVLIITTIMAGIGLLLSGLNTNMILSKPSPDTKVISGGKNLLIQKNGGSYARWTIEIKNKGTDEAEGIFLEMEFPDASTIDWTSNFVDWEGNWSRKPDYIETHHNYCLMRWNYLPAHGIIKVDLAINLSFEYPPDAKIDPNRILVTAKGEKSPIHEYP